MGKEIFKVVVGAAAIAVSFIPGVGPALSAGLLKLGIASAASGALGLVFGQSNLADRQASALQNTVNTQNAVPVCYGFNVKMGAQPVDFRVDDNSEDRKFLAAVYAIAHAGRNGQGIGQVRQVFFDEILAIDGPTFGDAFRSGSEIQNPWGPGDRDVVTYGLHDGDVAQAADSGLTGRFTEWTTDHRGLGVAYLVLGLFRNKEVLNTLPNITCLVDGPDVFDPRDDTWKQANNPALAIYDYLLADQYGLGAPDSEAHDASFIESANYFDDAQSRPADALTTKRITCNGMVDTRRSLRANLAELLRSCRSDLVYQNGQFRLVTFKQETETTFELREDDNILAGTFEFERAGTRGVATAVKAKFVDPDQNHRVNDIMWPRPQDSNPFITEDGGERNTQTIDLPFVTDHYVASEIAQVKVKESRQDIAGVLTARSEALQLQVGDVVPVTHSDPGWDQELLRVAAVAMLPVNPEDRKAGAGAVRIALTEYDPNAYTIDDIPQKTPPPGTNHPNPFDIGPVTGLTCTSDADTEYTTRAGDAVPGIRVKWTPPASPFFDRAEVFARRTLDADGNQVTDDWEPKGVVDSSELDANGDQSLLFPAGKRAETWKVKVTAVSERQTRADPATCTTTIQTSETGGNQCRNWLGKEPDPGVESCSEAGTADPILVQRYMGATIQEMGVSPGDQVAAGVLVKVAASVAAGQYVAQNLLDVHGHLDNDPIETWPNDEGTAPALESSLNVDARVQENAVNGEAVVSTWDDNGWYTTPLIDQDFSETGFTAFAVWQSGGGVNQYPLALRDPADGMPHFRFRMDAFGEMRFGYTTAGGSFNEEETNFDLFDKPFRVILIHRDPGSGAQDIIAEVHDGTGLLQQVAFNDDVPPGGAEFMLFANIDGLQSSQYRNQRIAEARFFGEGMTAAERQTEIDELVSRYAL